jgi:hypothetical protein
LGVNTTGLSRDEFFTMGRTVHCILLYGTALVIIVRESASFAGVLLVDVLVAVCPAIIFDEILGVSSWWSYVGRYVWSCLRAGSPLTSIG